jgi:hypothetical protein
LKLRPATDGSALGRLLVALGAPRGDKSGDTVTRIPPYLDDAPLWLQRDFARVYVGFRGTATPTGGGQQVSEIRETGERRALGALFKRASGNPDGVRTTSWPIRLYGAAKTELTAPPSFVAGPPPSE